MSPSLSLFSLFLLTLLSLSVSMYIAEKRAEPRKRPFCNAFTGCGRKRSDIPPLGPSSLGGPMGGPMGPGSLSHLNNPLAQSLGAEQESLGSLLDLSAEPAVEDLSRQIMSEAKLWEAIQEANVEIARQREARREGREACELPDCINL